MTAEAAVYMTPDFRSYQWQKGRPHCSLTGPVRARRKPESRRRPREFNRFLRILRNLLNLSISLPLRD